MQNGKTENLSSAVQGLSVRRANSGLGSCGELRSGDRVQAHAAGVCEAGFDPTKITANPGVDK